MLTRNPTQETYAELQSAYRYYNGVLFDDQLPPCLITLQRKRSAYGYFCGERYQLINGQDVSDEIALNPSYIAVRSTEEVLSTVVHEMVHLWQHHFASPGRGRYHNREWGTKMKAVGLYPSSTGQPGGKETGDRVSHYILPDGEFARVTFKLLATGFRLSWGDRATEDEDVRVNRSNREKYTCPECDFNAWAKPDAQIICGECNELMVSEFEGD